MSDHDTPEDEILDRLRAADPAAASRTDLGRLRAAVDARIAADAAADDDAAAAPARHGGPGSGSGAIVRNLAPTRDRRSSWLPVAAVAAGALVLTAAGYGLGLRAGTEDSPPTAAPAISLGGPAGGVTPGTTEALSGTADAAMYPAPSASRTSFHAVGLSDEAGTFAVRTYDPQASFSAERAAALGAALGLEGEPQLVGGAWQLGVTDGSGAYLMIFPDGTTTASFYDPAKDPHQCGRGEPGTTAPDAAGDAVDGTAAPYEWCDNSADAAPAPHGEDALSPVRALLSAAGYDPTTFELVENDYGDPSVTEVVAHQLLDGERTGSAWHVTVSASGVQSFNGMLAPLTGLGDYPVISPADAVDRLGDPRFGSFGEVRMLAAAENRVLDAPAEGADGTSADAPVSSGSVSQAPDAAPAGPPPAGTPGSPVPWPVEEVAITGARLGPALFTTPSGTALLVPAYELSADDGRTWSVIAVAEEALELAG